MKIISDPQRKNVVKALAYRYLSIVSFFLFLIVLSWIFFYRTNPMDYHGYLHNWHSYRENGIKGMYSQNRIEYPPLAVGVIILAGAIADAMSGFYIFVPGVINDSSPIDSQFIFAFRSLMAIVTVATFCLIRAYLRRYSQTENPMEKFERETAFTLSIACLGDLLLDRLDILLGMLILLSLLLLLSKRHFFWSFFVLAIGIDYKVAPVIMAPLFIIGTLPAAILLKRWQEIAFASACRASLMLAATLLPLLVFFLVGGAGCLDFFSYNRDRGIECESTYAAIAGILKLCIGLRVTYNLSYGSFNTESPLSPVFLSLAPLLIAAVVVWTTIAMLLVGLSRTAAEAGQPISSRRLCDFCRSEFIFSTVFVCTAFLLLNKVFSPQYLLWIIPIAPLAPFRGWKRRMYLANFLVLCMLTYLVGNRWFDQIVGEMHTNPQFNAGPTALGERILTSRTFVMLALVLALGLRVLVNLRNRAIYIRCKLQPEKSYE